MTLTLLRQKRILRDKKICKNVTNFTCMYSNEKKIIYVIRNLYLTFIMKRSITVGTLSKVS